MGPARHAASGPGNWPSQADIPQNWHLQLQVFNVDDPGSVPHVRSMAVFGRTPPVPVRRGAPLGKPTNAGDRFMLILLTTPDDQRVAPERRNHTGLDAIEVTRDSGTAPRLLTLDRLGEQQLHTGASFLKWVTIG